MKDRLYNIGAVVFFALALAFAVIEILRNPLAGTILFASTAVVFGVISLTQRLPVAQLNLTIRVTAENAPRIEPAAREFLAAIKLYVMILISWVACFSVFTMPIAVFLGVEAVLLSALIALVVFFVAKVTRLA